MEFQRESFTPEGSRSDSRKARLVILLLTLPVSTPNPSPRPQATSLPDNVVVVSQEEFLAVLSGVVNHPDPSHKVDHLLAGGVVQVVAALVTPVPVHPLQPELAAGSCPIRHDKPTPLAPRPPPRAGPRPLRAGSVLAKTRAAEDLQRLSVQRRALISAATHRHSPVRPPPPSSATAAAGDNTPVRGRQTPPGAGTPSPRARRLRERQHPHARFTAPAGFGPQERFLGGSPRLLDQASAYPNTNYPVRSLKFAVRGGFAAGKGIYSVTALI